MNVQPFPLFMQKKGKTMDKQSTSLVVRDRPITRWVIGAILVILAVLNPLSGAVGADTLALVIRAVLGLAGLGLILLSPVLTVTADRGTQMLTMHSKSLFTGKIREIPFTQIQGFQLEIHHEHGHSSSSRNSPSYRTVVVLKDGEVVPVHVFFSSGTMDKTKKIRQLREFIGVGGSDMGMGLLGTWREVTKMVKEEGIRQQEALTGSQDEVHETEGVHWQVQTVAFGGSPVTRWFSPDYRVPNGFIYVTQVVEGQKQTGGGLLGGLNGMLYRQAMGIYGFREADTPGIETAELLDGIDPSLAASFGVFTSVPDTAYRLLNPGAAYALADWAQRYPLKQFHTHPIFSQLVVMFAPSGVYVTCMDTMIPEAIEEMTRLGVDLLKAQENASESLHP
jgi:hypothetical protein